MKRYEVGERIEGYVRKVWEKQKFFCNKQASTVSQLMSKGDVPREILTHR